jgi:hypothetical protein
MFTGEEFENSNDIKQFIGKYLQCSHVEKKNTKKTHESNKINHDNQIFNVQHEDTVDASNASVLSSEDIASGKKINDAVEHHEIMNATNASLIINEDNIKKNDTNVAEQKSIELNDEVKDAQPVKQKATKTINKTVKETIAKGKATSAKSKKA